VKFKPQVKLDTKQVTDKRGQKAQPMTKVQKMQLAAYKSKNQQVIMKKVAAAERMATSKAKSTGKRQKGY
jgi:hypothetical protein